MSEGSTRAWTLATVGLLAQLFLLFRNDLAVRWVVSVQFDDLSAVEADLDVSGFKRWVFVFEHLKNGLYIVDRYRFLAGVAV